MGITWVEGFDAYNTNTIALFGTNFPAKYTGTLTSVGGPETSTIIPPLARSGVGRTGGFGVGLLYDQSHPVSPSARFHTRNFTTNVGTLPVFTPGFWTVGFAFKVPSTTTINTPLVAIMNDSTIQCRTFLLSDGRIQFRNGGSVLLDDGGTPTTRTSTLTIPFGQWFYFEIQTNISNSTSLMQIRINEAPYINITSTITTSTSVGSTTLSNSLFFGLTTTVGTSTVTPSLELDDFYVKIESTFTISNFAGDRKMESLVPVCDYSIEWTPFPAISPNYDNVNDIPLDDTNYNYANTAPVTDKFIFPQLSFITGSVNAVMVSYRMEKAFGTGDHPVAPVINTGVGTSQTLLNQYTYKTFTEVFEQEPSTTVGWSSALVDSSVFGYKLLS